LLHRVAAEIQRTFLRSGPVAVGTGVGGKYGRAAHLRENRREPYERRRRGSSA
jgi:PHP family Zn ribbon phosphoesterase